MLGLEMAIIGEKPQDRESEPIETDSDGVQKVVSILERIETLFRIISVCLWQPHKLHKKC
jgi:hypothetical protein